MPLHRRVPKRGFHNPFRVEYEVVNLDAIAEWFEAGTDVTPELLRERGLVGRTGRVKVLARGDISKALTIRAHKFSGKAAEKIAAAGGTAEVARRNGWRYARKPQEHLRGLGPAQARAVHARDARGLPRRQPHPDARASTPRRWRCWPSRRKNTMFGLYDMFSGRTCRR